MTVSREVSRWLLIRCGAATLHHPSVKVAPSVSACASGQRLGSASEIRERANTQSQETVTAKRPGQAQRCTGRLDDTPSKEVWLSVSIRSAVSQTHLQVKQRAPTLHSMRR